MFDTSNTDIQSNQQPQGDSTGTIGGSSSSPSSVTFTERGRVIVSNNGANESRFGYDKSFTNPSSSIDIVPGEKNTNLEETKRKKKPANWLDVLQVSVFLWNLLSFISCELIFSIQTLS